MAENRYYYLQLMDDIFTSRRIKKMRKIEHGDTMFVIYLKLQLVAMKHDGKLTYTGLEPTLSAELALDIDEKPENVEACLDFLLKTELAEQITENEIFLPWSVKNSRSEGASAERMRKKRAQEKKRNCNPTKSLNNVTVILNNVRTTLRIIITIITIRIRIRKSVTATRMPEIRKPRITCLPSSGIVTPEKQEIFVQHT